MTVLQHKKIIITGAAGLVGQNLTLLLTQNGFNRLFLIDKHEKNLKILARLNPGVTVFKADLSQKTGWDRLFEGAYLVIQLHAQITGLQHEDFQRNNVQATENVLQAMREHKVQRLIHISSSVVNSVAKDSYTQTKTEQESLVINSGLSYCILRPTLMFGWFDPKHLGWLSRFMKKVPIFPIPGHGKYLRQPLYCRDFCRVILSAIEQEKFNQTYDIVGSQDITYLDMIKLIKKVKNLHTLILKIPTGFFVVLMRLASCFMKSPPFTPAQLKALTAGDYFQGVDIKKEFGVEPTELTIAFQETFTHPQYSPIKLDR